MRTSSQSAFDETRRIRKALNTIGILLVSSLGALACTSASHTFDAIQEGFSPSAEETVSALTFVEAYFEFVGPSARWAGPPTWVLHVDVRNNHAVEFRFQPELLPNRTLASTDQNVDRLDAVRVRQELNVIAAAMQGAQSEPPSEPCLHPFRVRLVRVDGEILEREGCRTDSGWPRFAGEILTHWMSFE